MLILYGNFQGEIYCGSVGSKPLQNAKLIVQVDVARPKFLGENFEFMGGSQTTKSMSFPTIRYIDPLKYGPWALAWNVVHIPLYTALDKKKIHCAYCPAYQMVWAIHLDWLYFLITFNLQTRIRNSYQYKRYHRHWLHVHVGAYHFLL